MSEALILQSVNPQYNDRLFIDSWLQYKKNTTSEHVVYKHWFLFWSSKQCLYTSCSQLVFFLYWIQEWMNNMSSYCGLADSRISASEKERFMNNQKMIISALQVTHNIKKIVHWITSSVHESCKIRTWGEHAVYISFSECQNKNNLCTQHVLKIF